MVMDDLSTVLMGHARGSAAAPSRGHREHRWRRERRLGSFLAALFLLSGPVGFWVVQMLAGIALLPLLYVAEYLGAPFTWQATLWFAVATLAWAVLTYWTLRRIGLTGFPFLLLSTISIAWAVLPWVLITVSG
jgi:hypothetical protein